MVLKQLFRIPAATPHLVNPGQSVVITNSAIDHTANVGTSMNLIDADYEAKDAQGKTLNNPATPALELVYTAFSAISKMNIGQGGPTGVVLFRSTAAVSSWQNVYNYGKTSGSQWLAAGISQILDGVDILKYKNTGTIDLATKRLLPVIDAEPPTSTLPADTTARPYIERNPHAKEPGDSISCRIPTTRPTTFLFHPR